jgi:hypothetical protein
MNYIQNREFFHVKKKINVEYFDNSKNKSDVPIKLVDIINCKKIIKVKPRN